MLRRRLTGICIVIAQEQGVADMAHRGSLLVLTLISLAACASDGAPEQNACKQFQFEDDVTVKIREDAVGVLSARLEFGAPKDILSMEILIPGPDKLGVAANPEQVRLSASFRRLTAGRMACEVISEVRKVCFVEIPDSPLQMSADFNANVSEADASSVMDVLVDYVTTSVLDCR